MKVAVLGYGTVGTGEYEMLRTADGLEPGPVLVRKGKACEPFMTTDIGAVLSDPEVGAVVEAMGGVEPAYSYAREILSSGRHFVTSKRCLSPRREWSSQRLRARRGPRSSSAPPAAAECLCCIICPLRPGATVSCPCPVS